MHPRIMIGGIVIIVSTWSASAGAQVPAGPVTTDPFTLYFGYYRPRSLVADPATAALVPLPSAPPGLVPANPRQVPSSVLLYGNLRAVVRPRRASDPGPTRPPAAAGRDRPDDRDPLTSTPYGTTRDPGASPRFQNLHGYFPLANGR